MNKWLLLLAVGCTTACIHAPAQILPPAPGVKPFSFVQTVTHPSSACNILTLGQIDTVDNTAWICVTSNPALLTGTWQQLSGGGGGGGGSTNIFTVGTGTGIGPFTFTPQTTDTLRVFDNTPASGGGVGGSTTLTLQSGTAQTANNQNILQIQDNSGTNQSVVSWASGFPYWMSFAPTNITTFGTYNLIASGDAVARVKIGLDTGSPFMSFGGGSNALDVGIERSGPQSLSITQGAAFNNYGNLALNNLTIHGTCTGCGASNAITSITGDGTASGPGSALLTLATVNSVPGACGDATHVCQVTTNGKGLTTNQAAVAITFPSGSFYQTMQANGAAQTQRAKLNFAAGSNVTITPTDNGTDTTTMTIAASGTGGGASLATQLLDFAPGTIAASSIPFGASCNSTTPCFVNLGGTQYSFANTATLTKTAGTASDTIYYYVDGSGARTMGFNSANTYTCTNCENAPASGISAFPAGSYPLYQCSVTTGSFTACADKRPILASTPLSGGLGTTIAQTGGVKSINVSEAVRAVTGTTDALTNTDCANEVTYNNAGAVAVALPQAGLGGQFLSGCTIEVHNYGTGTVTITPAGTSKINNGAATLAIATGSGQRITSDGANYQLGAGGGSGGSFSGGTITNPLTIQNSNATGTVTDLTIQSTSGGNANMLFSNPAQSWTINENGSASNSDLYIKDVTSGSNALVFIPGTEAASFVGPVTEPSGSQITATSTAPACAATGDIGRLWVDNTDAANTHLKVCAEVSSALVFKQVF